MVIAKLIVQHVIQIKNRKMVNFPASAKSITHAKKIIVRILAHVFVRVVGTEKVKVNVCNEIISVTGSVCDKYCLSTNGTSNFSINFNNKIKN